LELAFCYIVAGASKAASPAWRSGSALPLVFRTRIYGNALIYSTLTKYPLASLLGCWFIIVAECAFSLAYILPQGGIVILGIMLSFHIVAAITMGLNGFLLAFLAAYPSSIYIVMFS
jgi:hypothetical protein